MKYQILALLFAVHFNATGQDVKSLYTDMLSVSRQCMLTQRVAKSYLAMHSLQDKSQELYITGSRTSFLLVHEELIGRTKDNEILSELNHLGDLWTIYMFFVEDDYNKDNMKSTIEMGSKIVNSCMVLLDDYKATIKTKTTKQDESMPDAVSKVALLSMHCNKAIIHIIAYADSIGYEEVNRKSWEDLSNFFKSSVKELSSFKKNTLEATQRLEALTKIWTDFEDKANKVFKAKTKDLTLLKELLIDVEFISKATDEISFVYEAIVEEALDESKK